MGADVLAVGVEALAVDGGAVWVGVGAACFCRTLRFKRPSCAALTKLCKYPNGDGTACAFIVFTLKQFYQWCKVAAFWYRLFGKRRGYFGFCRLVFPTNTAKAINVEIQAKKTACVVS